MDFDCQHRSQPDPQALAEARRAEAARWRSPRQPPWPPGVSRDPPQLELTPSRVVSPSLGPHQVVHTTPSPACTDEENEAARRESLRAQAEADRPMSAERVAYRRRQLALLRQVLSQTAFGRTLLKDP